VRLTNLENGLIGLFDWRLLYKSYWLLLRDDGAWDLNGGHLAALRRIGGFIFSTNTILLLRQTPILLLTPLITNISSSSNRVTFIIT
jgi:hypothetical protein